MLKKNAAIFLLMLAQAILLGHNVFPHHHDADHVASTHAAESESDGHFGHVFSHLPHADDAVALPGRPQSTFSAPAPITPFPGLLPSFGISRPVVPAAERPLIPPEPAPPFAARAGQPAALRGPPTFIV